MKRIGWSPFGKWALLGVSISVIVMAADSDETPAPAKGGRKKMQQADGYSRPAATKTHSASAEKIEFERLLVLKQQADSTAESGNAFNVVSWYVPPPPPPAPPATPPKPVAPPLPFTYIGRYANPDMSGQIVILGSADRVYTVSEGNVIDGTYRVGPVTGGLIELTYLPMNVKQSLNADGA